MATDGERALAMEEIRNKVVEYPHVVDKGDFAGVGRFYDGVTIRAFKADGSPLADAHTRDAEEVRKFYEEIIVVDENGSPNTQHLVSNVQVEVDEEARSGSSRSTFTVFNQGEGFPLQLIITGSYEDRWERREDGWKLVERHEHMGLVGDLSAHLVGGLDGSANH